MVDQGNIQVQASKKEQEVAHKVVNTEETILKEDRHDAKEKGHNEYHGDGGLHRKKAKDEGRVVMKSEGGFDMKI
jgi:hypothetical protein